MTGAVFDRVRFIAALKDRFMENRTGRILLEVLIASASLHMSLLKIKNFESIHFKIDNEPVRSVRDPEFNRLVLVLPESFEVSWDLYITGYYKVKHTYLPSPIPYQVPPFQINYSAVMIPEEGGILFKNEQVMLI